MKAGNLQIRWRYHSQWVTICSILKEDDSFVGAGNACLHDHDHFCKETGRKLSLARALKTANLPKEERTVVWEIYRNTKLGGRW